MACKPPRCRLAGLGRRSAPANSASARAAEAASCAASSGRDGSVALARVAVAPRARAAPASRQRGAQAQEAVQAALVVGRHAQVAERLGRRVAHAEQEHRRAVAHVHRQHVVVELARLAGGVAQLVADAGADVAQFLLGRRSCWRRPGARRASRAGPPCARRCRCRVVAAEVLDVDDAQAGVLQRHLVGAVALPSGELRCCRR